MLDRESIRLVRHDGKHDGQKVFQILRNHYCGTGRSKLLSLFTELGSLHKEQGESITAYVLRCEETLLSLKQCNHPIDDMMAIALVVKGLPSEYRHFRTIVFQTETIKSFENLKSALINFEHDELKHSSETKSEILYVKNNSNAKNNIKCYRYLPVISLATKVFNVAVIMMVKIESGVNFVEVILTIIMPALRKFQ